MDLLNRRHFSEIQLEQFVSVQNDGNEIWGAAFWQIRELLGPEDADRLLAKTWQALGTGDSQMASFYVSFVESLLENSKGVGDGSQVEAVRAILARRGISGRHPIAAPRANARLRGWRAAPPRIRPFVLEKISENSEF